MSTLISKPETIIKPETPMPYSTVMIPTPGDASSSKMDSKGAAAFAALAAPPHTPSSGSTRSDTTPPKSPVQSKSAAWPNSSNPWSTTVATVAPTGPPARFQTTNAPHYGSPGPRHQQGTYAVDRGDGTVSRLIPVDELPFDIVGVPRREAPGDFSVVSRQGPQGSLYQAVPTTMPRGSRAIAPPVSPPAAGLGSVRMDYQAPQSVRTGVQFDNNMAYSPVMPPAIVPVHHNEALQEAIDDIVSRPRVHQAQMVTRRQKIYCDKWLQTGNCGFQQVGCKYKHEMPMDRATQESVGLNGLPDWWTKSHGITLRPQTQGGNVRSAVTGRPGDKSWRNREETGGGLRAGLNNREFGIRPAAVVTPVRKVVPIGRQLENLAIDARNGGSLAIDTADRRTMTRGFSDMGSPMGASESRRDFGAIGDRLNNNNITSHSPSFPSPNRSFAPNSGNSSHYALLGEMADQRDKKFDGNGGSLDDDSQSDYSGGITHFN